MSSGILLGIPVLTYAASYVYLACYHERIFLWNTVVHEGGLTFWQDMFYASHFLGHIPVHLVVALVLVGSYLSLSGIQVKESAAKLLGVLVVFLAVSLIISVQFFSLDDTLAYIFQKKQGVVRFEKGGSWNLHLPSTMMQFLLVPLYVAAVRLVFKRQLQWNKRGWCYFAFAFVILISLTWVLNGNVLPASGFVWTEPRYLAHSVRELLTFPLTYYPIPLYFFLKAEEKVEGGSSKKIHGILILLAVVFAGLLIYQAIVPLTHGIGELAQKPAFAKGGELSIGYLLSAHYFEHFLDTIFFSLVCLILMRSKCCQRCS